MKIKKGAGKEAGMRRFLVLFIMLFYCIQSNAQDFIHYDSAQNVMEKDYEAIGTNLINSDGSEMGPFVFEKQDDQEELSSEPQFRKDGIGRDNSFELRKEEEFECQIKKM